MGIFDKLLGKTAAGSKESASQNVIETMMLNAEICMNEGCILHVNRSSFTDK